MAKIPWRSTLSACMSGRRGPAHDDHLRSPDFLDTARHPPATFARRAAGWRSTHEQLAGNLTIRGIARPVTLQAEYPGHVADPWAASGPSSPPTASSTARSGARPGT
jgi:polyisoprenoid-binding protein YceI